MLIGRARELGRLRALAIDQDTAREVVFMDGAMGIGKTALLTAFLDELPAPVLFARAAQTPAHIPFDGVRGIVETLLDDELPELLAAGTSLRTLRRRVREAIAAPALIVVDDAQWLDPDSIDLLTELLTTPTHGIRFLFVHRSGFTLERLTRAAARAGRDVGRLTVGPLADEDARRLLGRRDTVASLRLAGGNPLYLRLLAEIEATGDGEESAEVAAGLDDTLRLELAALPDPARTLLHALALSPPPPPSALGELTQLDEAAVQAASDLLAERGLADPQQLEILHPLIRAAAQRATPSAVRRRMHRVAAQHMTSPVDRAAHLRQLGAHLDESEVDALVEGAAMVLATAPRSALKLLERSTRIPHRGRDLLLARALLLDGRPRPAEELLRALSAEGDAAKEATALLLQSLLIQGRPDEAVELVREVSDWERHPEVAVEAATLMVMHEDTQDAALIEKAARSSSAPGVAAALSALTALAHLRHGDVHSARAPYEAARDGFTSIPSSDLLPVIGAVTAAGWSAHMVGDFDAGAAFVERAILIAERNGRFHALPHLYSILAFLYIPLDRAADVQELVDKAVDAAQRYDWPEVVPLATTAALVGAPDRAATEANYRRLVSLTLPRTWWWRQVAALFRARVEIRIGIPTDTAVLSADDGDVFGIQKRIGLGELALAAGDLTSARRHAAQAIAMGERFGVPYLSGQSAMFQAEVLHAQQRTAEARAAAHEAIELFTAAGAPLYARSTATWLRRLPAEAVPALTAREHDIAELVAEGLSNREIAEKLHLSVRTVESHVARILRKRGLRSRAGIARDLDAPAARAARVRAHHRDLAE